ncbi:MAG TPA: hypothetical protein VMV34_03045 [Terriglobia bacterium]|nr:hypothetical protein [Terriglobia bacterium]
MSYEASWLENQPPRLGDLIDDYCPRCKHLLNHAIASFVGDKVAKVICQTCFTEHAYTEGKEKKKAPKSGSTAFEQVLSKVAPAADPPAADPPAASAPKKAKPHARYITRHQGKPPKDNK